jgi:plasmid stability protein
MGIVKVSDEIHEQLRIASKALDRSLNSQAEHWLKIGMLSEIYRNKTYEELRNILFEQEDLTLEKLLKQLRKK